MTALQLAMRYMEIVYSGTELERLYDLFAVKLAFSGPFVSFDTAAGYVTSLQDDPPLGFEYTLRQTFENGNAACLWYEFSKPGICTEMAQLFEAEQGKLTRITLLFDSARFA